MTKDEFHSIYRKAGKQFNILGIIFLIYFFGMTFAISKLLDFIKTHTVERWVKLIPISLLLASFVILAILILFLRHKTKIQGLMCKNCKKLLVGQLGQIAIASGNCGNCGQKLFD
jgi:hypothetical protein